MRFRPVSRLDYYDTCLLIRADPTDHPVAVRMVGFQQGNYGRGNPYALIYLVMQREGLDAGDDRVLAHRPDYQIDAMFIASSRMPVARLFKVHPPETSWYHQGHS